MVGHDSTDARLVEELAALRKRVAELEALNLERETTEDTLRFLNEISTLLASSLEYETAFNNLARLIIPRLADSYTIDIARPDGTFQRAAAASIDPTIEKKLWEMAHTFPGDRRKAMVMQVMQSNKPLLVNPCSDAVLEGLAQNVEHLVVLKQLNLQAFIIVPLATHAQTIGSISLMISDPTRHYGKTDLALAEDLAHHTAIAIVNAQLYQEAQRNRQIAEQVADRNLALQAITVALSEALTLQRVAEILVNKGAAALGASSGGMMKMTDDGSALENMYVFNHPLPFVEKWQHIPITMQIPSTEAARDKRLIWVESPEDLLARYPDVNPAEIRHRAWTAVPLVIKGQVFGTICFAFDKAREFSGEEITFLLALADQGAQALERVRLYDTEQRSRIQAEITQWRVAFLAEASALLATSLDYTTTIKRVVTLMVPRFADYCMVFTLENDSQVRTVDVAHKDLTKLPLLHELVQQWPPALNNSTPVSVVLRTGEPIFLSDVSEAQLSSFFRDSDEFRLIRELAPVSYMVVPMLARGRMFGAIAFVQTDSGRHYEPADLELAQELARRAAVAIDNSRLYQDGQEALQHANESLALLDTLLTGAPIGLAFVDRDNRFVRINPAMAAIYQVPPTGHIGRTLGEVFPDLAFVMGPIIRHVLDRGEPIIGLEISTAPISDPNNRTYSLTSYYPVHTQHGELLGVGIVVIDITERKRAEDELRRAKDAAEAASRAKSNFLATMSHELRTPLNSVIGMSQVLLMKTIGPINPRQTESLNDILVCGRHLLSLINDVLELSRDENTRIQLAVERTDLADLVHESLSAFRQNMAEQQIELTVDVDQSLSLVTVERRRIMQVILNLLSNAVKFTPAGGRITLRLYRQRHDNDHQAYVRFEVQDTGIGISPENQLRLFRPFERLEDIPTARQYEGTGLGLALSKRFIELHHGTIGVESPGEGQGSIFWFTLPLEH